MHVLLAVLFPWLLVLKLLRGRLARSTWQETLFQLFSVGSSPSQGVRLTEIRNHKTLRCVCISDTHMMHEHMYIPDGDVLIHCGDFTNHGSLDEVQKFADWIAKQPHPIKIIVPGNHDMILDQEYYKHYWSDWSTVHEDPDAALRCLSELPGTHVLLDRGVNIGGINVFGSPYVPQYASWRTGFNKTKEELREHWERTVESLNGRAEDGNIDILLTHTPALGTADRDPTGHRGGCASLVTAVEKLQPKFHVCGHIHSDHGAFATPLPAISRRLRQIAVFELIVLLSILSIVSVIVTSCWFMLYSNAVAHQRDKASTIWVGFQAIIWLKRLPICVKVSRLIAKEFKRHLLVMYLMSQYVDVGTFKDYEVAFLMVGITICCLFFCTIALVLYFCGTCNYDKQKKSSTTTINASSVCDYYWTGLRAPIVFDCPSPVGEKGGDKLTVSTKLL